MLTVEKDRVSLQLQQRDQFFTRTLIKAFGLALLLHLLGLGLFHVKQIVSTESRWLFPPMQLETPIIERVDALITTSLDESLIPDYLRLIATEPSPLKPPSLDSLMTLSRDLPFTSESEARSYRLPLLAPLKIPYHEMNFIHLSGSIGDRYLPTTEEMDWPLIDHNYHLAYEIMIDDQTGKVLSYSALHSGVPSFLEKEAEKRIVRLQFSPKEHSAISSGMVEFHLQERIHQERVHYD